MDDINKASIAYYLRKADVGSDVKGSTGILIRMAASIVPHLLLTVYTRDPAENRTKNAAEGTMLPKCCLPDSTPLRVEYRREP